MQFLAGGKIIAAECSCFEYFSYISLSNIHKKPDNRKPDCARFGKGFRQRKARSSDRAFRKKQDGMPALFGRIFS